MSVITRIIKLFSNLSFFLEKRLPFNLLCPASWTLSLWDELLIMSVVIGIIDLIYFKADRVGFHTVIIRCLFMFENKMRLNIMSTNYNPRFIYSEESYEGFC